MKLATVEYFDNLLFPNKTLFNWKVPINVVEVKNLFVSWSFLLLFSELLVQYINFNLPVPFEGL